MAGRSKPMILVSPISVTGTVLISGYLVASTSSYSTSSSSSQSIKA